MREQEYVGQRACFFAKRPLSGSHARFFGENCAAAGRIVREFFCKCWTTRGSGLDVLPDRSRAFNARARSGRTCAEEKFWGNFSEATRLARSHHPVHGAVVGTRKSQLLRSADGTVGFIDIRRREERRRISRKGTNLGEAEVREQE